MQVTKSSLVEQWKLARKYIALLGGILVYLPIGVPWYFGNLVTYISSYFHAQVENETDLVDPQWIFSSFFIVFTLAVTASGYIVEKIGVRLTLLIAMVIHSGATFFTYFAIQYSMAVLVVVFGAIGGLGAGLAYGPPLPVVIKWMPRRVGVASGVLLTGFGGGAIFYNELITAFINPNNIRADVEGVRTKFFSQPEILARVPQIFLVLGSLTVGLQALGVLLLRAPQDGDYIDSIDAQEIKPIATKPIPPEKTLPLSAVESIGSIHNGTSSALSPPPHEQQQHLQHIRDGASPVVVKYNATDETVSIPTNTANATSSTSSTRNSTTTLSNVSIVQDTPPNKTPKQMLQDVHFYILWFALAVNHYGYIIKNNFYKEFGQSEISNDHFLTLTGTLGTVAVALARLFWGWLTDLLGVKPTLILFMASTVVLCAYWYLALYHSPVVYMVVIIIISFILSGAFIVFPLAALKLFGDTHYSTNYGLILSAQIVMNIISPPINRAILMGASWFWLFFSISLLNAIGMFFSLFLKNAK